jgi:diaminohydroxyphosphoribosylaminopyrimidine deaminase/5-amino-6-(5-phosphoribosylamino)uracil reductase
MFSEQDHIFMKRALQLAALGGVEAAPNPMVGAVIVHEGKIIGEGYHRKFGGPHAEVNAVESVSDQSLLAASTMYVTLEPCAHHGKTPPCSNLLIDSQFPRVVIACQDTFAKVAGKGIEKMKKAGIQVDVGLMEQEARQLNKRFFTFHEKKRPFVILKWAQTLDGFIDRHAEDRHEGINWITTPDIKPLVHQWRGQEQAIMVGWKTIQNDNSALTVREIAGESPHRFIIDPHCQTPTDSIVLTDGNPTTLFVKENKFKSLPKAVTIQELPTFSSASILSELYKADFLSVFIEGGRNTLQHFIDDDLWDEARILEGPTQFYRGVPAPNLQNGKILDSTSLKKNRITFVIPNAIINVA